MTGLFVAVIVAVTTVTAVTGPVWGRPDASPAREYAVTGQRPSALGRYLSSLRLINYFPSDAGWQYMWTRWDAGQINRDFATMAAMGANSVRITVFPSVMGFPVPSPLMRSRLSRIAAIARGHGLKVQLSLFDQFTDFSDIQGSLTWARDVLTPLNGSPDIAFIDLRNELDAPSTLGNLRVYHWIDALLPAVERDAPGVPVTLSVTASAHITAMRAALRIEPDFWDLHYYSSAGLAYKTMADAIRAAAPRPVFVGETGFATTEEGAPPGLPAGEPALYAYQAHYYQVVERAALSLGLGAAAPWALYDFSQAAIPSRQQPDQYAFGLLQENGTPKPAAGVIRTLFRSGKVGGGFNGDFSQAVTTPREKLPAVWQVWDGGQAHFALDPSVGHDAPGSGRISGSGGSDDTFPAFYTVPVQPEIVPGDRYRVTAWARGQRATGTTVVNISWFNRQGVFMSGIDSARLGAGDTGWTELEATGVAPPGAAFAEIWLKSARNSGTAWFDDVTWAGVIASRLCRRHWPGAGSPGRPHRSFVTAGCRGNPAVPCLRAAVRLRAAP
ncbi:MAG: hypothetical protein ACRDN0_09085 [Trebonia sp.]